MHYYFHEMELIPTEVPTIVNLDDPNEGIK